MKFKDSALASNILTLRQAVATSLETVEVLEEFLAAHGEVEMDSREVRSLVPTLVRVVGMFNTNGGAIVQAVASLGQNAVSQLGQWDKQALEEGARRRDEQAKVEAVRYYQEKQAAEDERKRRLAAGDLSLENAEERRARVAWQRGEPPPKPEPASAE